MSDLSLRYAETEADAKAIFLALVPFYQEVGRTPMNAVKALTEIDRIIKEDAAVIVERDGEIVGTFGLTAAPLWYSDEDVLSDAWLYVVPGERGQGAMALMLAEAKALSQMSQRDVIFTLSAGKRTRPPKTEAQMAGATLGYSVGRILKIDAGEV